MSIKIGHAVIDENRNITGGKAGDQTGKELKVSNYYAPSGGWDYTIRAKSRMIAFDMATVCRMLCADNKVGYNQSNRNSLHRELKAVGYDIKRLSEIRACETDCSAFMVACAITAGAKSMEYSGNAPTTRTMRKAFAESGDFLILDGDVSPLIGDIRVKEGSHTVMIVNGAPIYDSPIFLKGRTYTTIYNMVVREKPSLKGRRLTHEELTENAKLHDEDKNGTLEKGTKVTCKDTATADGITWLKIPSGWIAGYNTDEGFAYVK